MNEKATIIFQKIKDSNKLDFKNYAMNLKNDKGGNLYEDISLNANLKNIQYTMNQGFSTEEKILVSLSKFELGSSQHFLVILRDVTQFLKLQEANISHRYQNILLFSAPHEVRSQLNIISGNLDRLEQKFDSEVLKMIKYSCKILEYKLNLIFDFVHIVTGKFAPHIKKYQFKDFVQEIIDIVGYYSKAKNLQLIHTFRSSCEIISFDYERMIQIIIHIALNAIKYTMNGFIEMCIQYKKGILSVKIKDSGIGINDDCLNLMRQYCNKSLMDINNILRLALDGLEKNKLLSGLGLLCSSLLARKLDGRITIQSKKNRGTTILISIKCQRDILSSAEIFDESCICEWDNDIQEIKYQMKSFSLKKACFDIKDEHFDPRFLLIMVVDDQKFNRITLMSMLKILYKFEIIEAENGLEAVSESLQNMHNYKKLLIFMDIDMPIMNGIESTREIKKNDDMNSVIIVMLSAFNTEEIIKESKEAGASDFYVKPISFKKLKELRDSYFLNI